MTRDEVKTLIKDFLFSGMPVAREDEDGAVMKAAVTKIQTIIDIYMTEISVAAKEYMRTEDLDALIQTLLPVHEEIWYRAYAPYWLSHCKPVDDRDSETEFTYYNDLINMYWAWQWQEWKKKDEWCVTIMLPPTKGLIEHAYQEAQRSLREYLEKQAEGKAEMTNPSA